MFAAWLVSAALIVCQQYAIPADVPVGTNLVGIYTATDGTGLNNADITQYTSGTFYLCITGCEFTSILGWELRIRNEAAGGTMGVNVSAWNINGSWVNADSPPGFAVGLASPLPQNASSIIVPMSIDVFVLGQAYFYLELPTAPSIPGNMAMLDGDDVGHIVAIHHPLDDLRCPVFGINTVPIIDPIETATWGAVRRLWR